MVIPYSWVGSHALLTRAPLSTTPKDGFTFDLHVLGMPPAFVLSQDQTLMLTYSPTAPGDQNRPKSAIGSLASIKPGLCTYTCTVTLAAMNWDRGLKPYWPT